MEARSGACGAGWNNWRRSYARTGVDSFKIYEATRVVRVADGYDDEYGTLGVRVHVHSFGGRGPQVKSDRGELDARCLVWGGRLGR